MNRSAGPIKVVPLNARGSVGPRALIPGRRQSGDQSPGDGSGERWSFPAGWVVGGAASPATLLAQVRAKANEIDPRMTTNVALLVRRIISFP